VRHEKLPQQSKTAWLWWHLPSPPPRKTIFADIVEDEPHGVEWHSPAETRAAQCRYERDHQKKGGAGQEDAEGGLVRGCLQAARAWRTTGTQRMRAEIRFDDIAGCLRTPVGGSSRQSVRDRQGDKIRRGCWRLARRPGLMGLPEGYKLPENYNDGYHLVGGRRCRPPWFVFWQLADSGALCSSASWHEEGSGVSMADARHRELAVFTASNAFGKGPAVGRSGDHAARQENGGFRSTLRNC